MALHLTTNMI